MMATSRNAAPAVNTHPDAREGTLRLRQDQGAQDDGDGRGGGGRQPVERHLDKQATHEDGSSDPQRKDASP